MDPITLTSLNEDIKKINTPTVLPDTTATGFIEKASNQSLADTEQEKIEAEKLATETEISKLNKLISETSAKEAGYATQAGADIYKGIVDVSNARINALSKQLRTIQQDLFNNPNLTRSQAVGAYNEEARKISSEIADLSISSQLNKGDYDSAIKTAKEKVAIELSPLMKDLKQKQKFADELRGNISDIRMKKIDANIATEREKVKTQEAEKLASQEMIVNAMSQGASTSITNKAQDLYNKGASKMEIASALGQYAGDYLGNAIKKASLAKTNAEINKIQNEIKSSSTSIDTSTLPNTTKGFATKLMASAKSDKNLDATERQQLTKMTSVIGQLDSLESNLNKNNKTGVIVGRVNKLLGDLNLDKDITTINAQIQALIPNVARGIYGEVGVLTDADIENYKKTVANLKFSKDQNDAVLALTLKNALRSYEGTLNTAVNSNINVSGWTQDYVKIQNKVNEIEDRIGVSKEAVNNLISKNSSLSAPIKEMYSQGFTDGEILEALNA